MFIHLLFSLCWQYKILHSDYQHSPNPSRSVANFKILMANSSIVSPYLEAICSNSDKSFWALTSLPRSAPSLMVLSASHASMAFFFFSNMECIRLVHRGEWFPRPVCPGVAQLSHPQLHPRETSPQYCIGYGTPTLCNSCRSRSARPNFRLHGWTPDPSRPCLSLTYSSWRR